MIKHYKYKIALYDGSKTLSFHRKLTTARNKLDEVREKTKKPYRIFVWQDSGAKGYVLL